MPKSTGRKYGLSSGVRIYLLTVAAVSLIAVLVVIFFFSDPNPQSPQLLRSGSDSSVYSRLLLPEDKRGLIADDHVPLRSRRLKWSREQVDRFWIPPESIVLQLLKKENDAVLEDIFESVP